MSVLKEHTSSWLTASLGMARAALAYSPHRFCWTTVGKNVLHVSGSESLVDHKIYLVPWHPDLRGCLGTKLVMTIIPNSSSPKDALHFVHPKVLYLSIMTLWRDYILIPLISLRWRFIFAHLPTISGWLVGLHSYWHLLLDVLEQYLKMVSLL